MDYKVFCHIISVNNIYKYKQQNYFNTYRIKKQNFHTFYIDLYLHQLYNIHNLII